MEQRRKPVGVYLRMIARAFHKRADEQVGKRFPEITAIQAQTMGYLMHHENNEVLTKDYERAFEIQGSTACKILQSMERKGLINRVAVDGDQRAKKICLTEKAKEIDIGIVEELMKVENCALRGVSEEELNSFYRVADKIYENLVNEEEQGVEVK